MCPSDASSISAAPCSPTAALTSGAIDLYPEYSGTALTAVLKLPPSRDAAAVMRQVVRRIPQAVAARVAAARWASTTPSP